MPKSALTVEEKAWNAYPYTRTIYTCPFVEKFSLDIETVYKEDVGQLENVFNLNRTEMRDRTVGEPPSSSLVAFDFVQSTTRTVEAAKVSLHFCFPFCFSTDGRLWRRDVSARLLFQNKATPNNQRPEPTNVSSGFFFFALSTSSCSLLRSFLLFKPFSLRLNPTVFYRVLPSFCPVGDWLPPIFAHLHPNC